MMTTDEMVRNVREALAHRSAYSRLCAEALRTHDSADDDRLGYLERRARYHYRKWQEGQRACQEWIEQH